jgi:hypothetical protein
MNPELEQVRQFMPATPEIPGRRLAKVWQKRADA